MRAGRLPRNRTMSGTSSFLSRRYRFTATCQTTISSPEHGECVRTVRPSRWPRSLTRRTRGPSDSMTSTFRKRHSCRTGTGFPPVTATPPIRTPNPPRMSGNSSWKPCRTASGTGMSSRWSPRRSTRTAIPVSTIWTCRITPVQSCCPPLPARFSGRKSTAAASSGRRPSCTQGRFLRMGKDCIMSNSTGRGRVHRTDRTAWYWTAPSVLQKGTTQTTCS